MIVAMAFLIGIMIHAAPALAQGSPEDLPFYHQIGGFCMEIYPYGIAEHMELTDDSYQALQAGLADSEDWLACQDQFFNLLYQSLKSTLPKLQNDKLTKSEKAWIQVRDLTCDLIMDAEPGLMGQINYNVCIADMTFNRILDLVVLSVDWDYEFPWYPEYDIDYGNAVYHELVSELDLACQTIIGQDYVDYLNSAPTGSTMELTQYGGEWLVCQDQFFNLLYQVVKDALPEAQEKKLTDSELKWIETRDFTCDIAYDSTDGTMAGMVFNDCLMNITNSRINDLMELEYQWIGY